MIERKQVKSLEPLHKVVGTGHRPTAASLVMVARTIPPLLKFHKAVLLVNSPCTQGGKEDVACAPCTHAGPPLIRVYYRVLLIWVGLHLKK